jgi:hypothetical protein
VVLSVNFAVRVLSDPLIVDPRRYNASNDASSSTGFWGADFG